MQEEGRTVSVAQLCRWFGVARSSFYYRERCRQTRPLNPALVELVRAGIAREPSHGVPMLTAAIRRETGLCINHKAIRRIVQLNGWQVCKRPKGQRPRTKAWRSQASQSNERWAIDTTHLICGRDGWCHLTAVIDCHDRSLVGWRLSKSGKASVAAGALEDALRARRPTRPLTIRSDNGLVFGAADFVRVVKQYGLSQEYITPYTPEQNGMIERFFRTLKEECIWHHRFASQDEAFVAIANYIDHYNQRRPHSALGYQPPAEYIMKLAA